MRFLRKDLKEVFVFYNHEKESSYVGTETVPMFSHKIKAVVQPAANKLNAEIYGERVHSMYRLICDSKQEISENCLISFHTAVSPQYKIISVMRYTAHSVILAEVI